MKKKYVIILIGFLVTVTMFSCKKYLNIDPPRTGLTRETVFNSNATANAAMLDIYYDMSQIGSFAGGGPFSISFWGSLLSDEQINYYISTPTLTAEFQQFNDNALQANNSNILSLWTSLYKCIYKSNAVLEGLSSSSNVTQLFKTQLEGEAKFIRAFCHFYLVNLWGDVPLALTTDYKTNQNISRTETTKVYEQIVLDLKDAQNLLTDAYSFSNNERVRANKGAATALLARVYLYMSDWTNAEMQSSILINNTSQYNLLTNMTNVFHTTSSEIIWQLWSQLAPNDRGTFRVVSTPAYGALRSQLATSFDASDSRKTTWVNLNSSGYYNARKYNFSQSNPPTQYSTVMRLAEQYLIRAEARTKLGKVTGSNSAEMDINAIRNRAGLANTTANTQVDMLLAIEQERRWELFTEWGHRWFDLVRTGKANTILNPLKSKWTVTDIRLPIPESEIFNNSELTQNPGY